MPTSRWCRDAYSISDPESFAAARDLLRKEGVLRRLLVRHAAGRGAALLPRADDAEAGGEPRLRFRRQISLQGVQRRLPGAGGLDRSRTLRHRARPRHQPLSRGHGAVEVRPQDTLRTVFARMRAADVSQLPVVDEDDASSAWSTRATCWRRCSTATTPRRRRSTRPVKDVMVTRLETISADAPIADLVPLFRKDYVAIVMDGEPVPRPRDPHRPHQSFPDRGEFRDAASMIRQRRVDPARTSRPMTQMQMNPISSTSPRAASMPARSPIRPPAR